jgi:arabinose-5-phosphate isomerase
MSNLIAIAKEVILKEANSVKNLVKLIDPSFENAVNHILDSNGKVIVSGMGKSGIIGKKIAATLASTGTESFFMHPGEAYHGDLGMVNSNDIFLAISNSGETDEVIKLIPFLKDNKNLLISLTGNPTSTLAVASDIHINISVEKEACPLQLAPTSSTTATLVMGDALAIALMKSRNFMPENFARFHPGGYLGKRLLCKVEDEMFKIFPVVSSESKFIDVLHSVTKGKLGTVVVTHNGKYSLITDGDIRRAVEDFGSNVFDLCAFDIMSQNPLSITKGTKMHLALEKMEHSKVSCLLVMSGHEVVGILKK